MAEQQVLTKWCLFWGSGSKHASKIYTQKKKRYTSLQNVRAAKSWLMHTALPFCVEFFLLAPIHFVRFLQDPAVYSYSTIVKSDHSTIVKSDPLGWISRGIISRGIISRGISHISTYLSCFIIPDAGAELLLSSLLDINPEYPHHGDLFGHQLKPTVSVVNNQHPPKSCWKSILNMNKLHISHRNTKSYLPAIRDKCPSFRHFTSFPPSATRSLRISCTAMCTAASAMASLGRTWEHPWNPWPSIGK